MSPEYESNYKVPKDFLKEIKAAMKQFDIAYPHAIHAGYGVCKPNGHITKVSLLPDLSEGVISDGRKQNSAWHIVNGLAGSPNSNFVFKEEQPLKRNSKRRSRKFR